MTTESTLAHRKPAWLTGATPPWEGNDLESIRMSGTQLVKILYHDNCFDGAASASLFSRFYKEKIDHRAQIVFSGKNHGQGAVYASDCFDGDVNVVVDFRYSPDPRLTWWFDHHVSAFPKPADEAHWKSTPRENHYYDPKARSCAKFLATTLEQKFDWHWNAYEDLVYWADLIDGAQFESPQAAVELAAPALELMCWVENNHDAEHKLRFIDELTRRPLQEIAREPWVRAVLGPVKARQSRAIDLIKTRSVYADEVVFFDVSDDGLDGHNKFIPYYLFPHCTYVISVSSSASRVKVSVGSNPWFPEKRRANIAAICESYGGGGHPVVGAISLGPDDLAKARQIAAEITGRLQKDVRERES